MLAVGLSQGVSGYNPLPNVEEEIDGIVLSDNGDERGIYPGLKFLNGDFDRRRLRDNLAAARIVHIATHGQFVPGTASDSYLLLGNGEKLPVPEIENFRDLGKIHLVVLSACETALGGPDQDGKEIAGIAYYFLNGGAKSVVASLWQVDDTSTSLLMRRFYRYLATKSATKAEALRMAQLSLLHETAIGSEDGDSRSIRVETEGPGNATRGGFNHPYFWAPFILIGNSL